MIRAVLLDLDDTLITTNTAVFHRRYLSALGKWMAERIDTEPDAFIKRLLATYEGIQQHETPLNTLYDRTMQALEEGDTREELATHFTQFYDEVYPTLITEIKPRPHTPVLLDALFEQGIRVVVATNPGLPIEAIHQRMEAGGLPIGHYPFEFVTSMQTMYFGKPAAAYYAEIAIRLQLAPSQLLMVGDDHANDIVGARAAGLHTYHLEVQTWPQFVEMVCQGGLIHYVEQSPSQAALMARLRAFPSVVAGLATSIPAHLMEQCPAENEWSLRDVVYHLADYELDQNQAKLTAITTEENPFLSGEYDPWEKAVDYGGRPIEAGLSQFSKNRAATLAWLGQQPAEVWQRPARSSIFGPTNFAEVVRFATKHDATHQQQMLDVIDCIHRRSR